ncbi:MAG: hypothetical protein II981_02940 [Bacteroidales bacterium]|nr:hypothetical protein [Bacteroidales bacterium]MBQ3594348.1 hypothetical protein [Bacteroidales bacterium]
MESNELNPEKSLQIISEAVRRSRREFEKNAGTPLIIWGMSILLLSLVVWFVWKSTDNPAWNFLWFSTIILWIVFSVIDKKKEKKVKTKNFLGEIIGYVWISYGIFAIGLSAVFCVIFNINSNLEIYFSSVFLVLIIGILLGFSAMITGLLVKNKWIVIAGVINGLGTPLVVNFLSGDADITLLISIASLITLLIPGIILNLQSKKE